MNLSTEELKKRVQEAVEEADRQASISLWKLISRIGMTVCGISIGVGWGLVNNDWIGIPMVVLGLIGGIFCVRYLRKHI